MKNVLIRHFLSFAVSFVIASFGVGSASAQSFKVAADKPSFDDMLSPEFNIGNKQKPFRPKDWLEMEVKLKIAGSDSKAKVCEKLTVKWYVAVKNPAKTNTMLLLTKDVEHVNVLLDEEVYCSVYLSPVSIKRLTGSDRAGKSSVEAVGYEVLINGEKVAQETTKFKVGWWNVPSEKISRTDTVPLLNKAETPFRAMWWDRYAEVNESRTGK